MRWAPQAVSRALGQTQPLLNNSGRLKQPAETPPQSIEARADLTPTSSKRLSGCTGWTSLSMSDFF